VVEPRHAQGDDPLAELRRAIQALHAAGIEVLLDVVYNHTGEGDGNGPCLAYRGLDNLSYYRLDREAPDGYANLTGCGNNTVIDRPRVLQLIMDSLRYWSRWWASTAFASISPPLSAASPPLRQGGRILRLP
jgi:glycogen operon protein